MDAVQPPWARQPKEPTQWHERFQRFLLAGPARSVYQTYLVEHDERAAKRKTKKTDVASRPGLPKSWRGAVRKWNWADRAAAWDDEQRRRRTELFQARRDEILSTSFAVQFVRIAGLVRLAELLQAEIWTEDKRWLHDVKQIGSGDDAKRVDIVRFNAALLEQYRQTLADIATELGDRAQKVKLGGTMKHEIEITSDEMAQARAKAQAYETEKFGNE